MAVKTSFRILRVIVKAFTPKMKTVWDMPFDGEAAVFCPNHDRAMGPIAMCVHFPLWKTCHPWYNQGVADRKGLPAYIRNDNWWNPNARLAPLYNAVVPHLGALFMPPIIHCTPGIPVYYDGRLTTTFRQSLKVLKEGEHLVIFAQYPDGYQSHSENLSRGFVLIAPMAYKRLGITLKFYPVHVDARQKTIHVMAPIAFDPDAPWEEEQERLLQYLGERVKD